MPSKPSPSGIRKHSSSTTHEVRVRMLASNFWVKVAVSGKSRLGSSIALAMVGAASRFG